MKALVSMCAQAWSATVGLRSPVSVPSVPAAHRPEAWLGLFCPSPLGLDSQILLLV